MRAILAGLAAALVLAGSLAYADDVSHRAAAEEYLRLIKADQMLQPMFRHMQALMEKQFTQMGAPDALGPILQRYTERLFRAMEEALGWQTMKNDLLSLYVETFTEAELQGLVAFYETPAGQAFTAKMPLLMQKSMELTQRQLPAL